MEKRSLPTGDGLLTEQYPRIGRVGMNFEQNEKWKRGKAGYGKNPKTLFILEVIKGTITLFIPYPYVLFFPPRAHQIL